MQCIGTSWHNKQIRGGYFLGKGRVPICGLRWLYISHQLAKYWKNTEFSISQKHPFWQKFTASRDPWTIGSNNQVVRRFWISPGSIWEFQFHYDLGPVQPEGSIFLLVLIRSGSKIQILGWSGSSFQFFSAGLGTYWDRSVLVRRSLTVDNLWTVFSWSYPVRDLISPRSVLKTGRFWSVEPSWTETSRETSVTG